MDLKAGAVFLELLLQAVFDVQQTVQEERVEEAAFPIEDHPDGFFVSESVLVDALACQGIVDVSDRYDLCGDRDGIALEAVGVSATVPALVMPAADGVSHLDKGLFPKGFQMFDHLRADQCVRLHDLEFFLGQLAGLVQDLLIDTDLADVVESGGIRDEGFILPGEMVAAGALHDT